MALKLLIAFALGALALTLWVQVRAARHEAAAEASHPPEGRIITVDGRAVHMVEMGQGPDLVLIHGASGNTRDMTFALAPALAQHYRVLVFDRPGLGYSDRLHDRGETLTEQAALLARAASQLGADRPLVLGQSYGAGVALTWALDHPVAGVVSVSGVAMPWEGPLDWQYRVTSSRVGSWLAVPLITAFVPDAYVTRVLDSVFVPQPVPDGYAAHFGPGLTLRRHTTRANARQRANLLSEIKEIHSRYGDITVPVELLHGGDDLIVPARTHAAPFVARVPSARLTLLPGVGHMPHQTHVADVVAAVDRAARRAGLR